MNRTCMNCNREYSCDWHAAGDRACCENWEPDIEQNARKNTGKQEKNFKTPYRALALYIETR